MPTEYMSTRDAAAYLGLSAKSLEKHRQLRSGPAYIKLGHAVRYRRADLDAYMIAHLVLPFVTDADKGAA